LPQKYRRSCRDLKTPGSLAIFGNAFCRGTPQSGLETSDVERNSPCRIQKPLLREVSLNAEQAIMEGPELSLRGRTFSSLRGWSGVRMDRGQGKVPKHHR